MTSTIIALTIDVNYLPEWGVREGLRELVQNWLDAADDIGKKGTAGYNPATKILSLHNPGADLSESALLIGKTSKLNRDDQRGQFGEGLKFGSLALVREDRKVVIRTRKKVWIAKIEASEVFAGEKVLTWHVMDALPHNGVSVTISPVGLEEYAHIRNTFMHFIKTDKDKVIETRIGKIFLDKAFQGQVYVKGILIMESNDLEFGYDFSNIQVDRDRKMIRQYSLESESGRAWIYAHGNGHERASADNLLQMITDGYSDVAAAKWWDSGIKRKIAKAFAAKYPDAIPVRSDEEASALAHYGAIGRNVGNALSDFFDGVSEVKNVDEVIKRLGRSPKRIFEYSEVSEEKIQNFLWASGELEAVLPGEMDVLSRVRIVDFHNGKLEGLWRSTGEIDLASRFLHDKLKILQILVHEFAHDYGNDGDKNHVHMIEKFWKLLAENWLS